MRARLEIRGQTAGLSSDRMLPDVAGLDVGFSKKRKSTGVGLFRNGCLSLEHLSAEEASNRIGNSGPFTVIAIDGPLLPIDGIQDAFRAIEHLFVRGKFALRCKPGMSHFGMGFQLRAAAQGAANRVCARAPASAALSTVPLIREGMIVEAFPNAFLGVCIDDECYAALGSVKRGKKFDCLYEQWINRRVLSRVLSELNDDTYELEHKFAHTTNHDERAAIVCVLTALFVGVGNFTAIGNSETGWFFLPPWSVWAGWAKEEVERLRASAEHRVEMRHGKTN